MRTTPLLKLDGSGLEPAPASGAGVGAGFFDDELDIRILTADYDDEAEIAEDNKSTPALAQKSANAVKQAKALAGRVVGGAGKKSEKFPIEGSGVLDVSEFSPRFQADALPTQRLQQKGEHEFVSNKLYKELNAPPKPQRIVSESDAAFPLGNVRVVH